MNLNFNDFQKQSLKFDINKLRKAYEEVLSIKGFSGINGVSNFSAISLTQIPGDPESIKGHKARGVFWTKPDSSGKEVMRDETINEFKYSEFIKDYQNTCFKEVYDALSQKYDCTNSTIIRNLKKNLGNSKYKELFSKSKLLKKKSKTNVTRWQQIISIIQKINIWIV